MNNTESPASSQSAASPTRLTPEAQRIAIAEACGWTKIGAYVGLKGVHGHAPGNPFACLSKVPDYLNDLNAMHEAERLMPMLQASSYGSELAKFADRDIEFHEDTQIGPLDVFAWAIRPASERAEAYLRAIGKWVETPKPQ